MKKILSIAIKVLVFGLVIFSIVYSLAINRPRRASFSNDIKVNVDTSDVLVEQEEDIEVLPVAVPVDIDIPVVENEEIDEHGIYDSEERNITEPVDSVEEDIPSDDISDEEASSVINAEGAIRSLVLGEDLDLLKISDKCLNGFDYTKGGNYFNLENTSNFKFLFDEYDLDKENFVVFTVDVDEVQKKYRVDFEYNKFGELDKVSLMEVA